MTASKMINGQRLVDTLRRYRHETISIEGLEALISQMESAQSVDRDMNVPDNDTISRQTAIDEWKNDFKGYINALNMPKDDYNGIMEYINEMPSAQPEDRCSECDAWNQYKNYPSAQPERKKGEWICGEHDIAMCDGYWCDQCGFFVPWDYKHKSIDFIKDYHWCPSCGADMRGKGD